ncbi:hypothetical protein VOLCADRAFT_90236 [Volvox carteri f. nagariensis]|uniref:Uncharacterized protein n=1 Tax=Volvox carteri f. nagariensis TaxID=3068 RepID=D8TTU2_VOLCA|nr:uncharacterized protein VOLCADRAFT_90236 [Volvox carteri f. nagariensis]EFJ49028.1 hypothetical protein VOLCADRAFT_90236 [Volvox carteri f. nagariensis]|eukprot:XP_002949925.1 hypothetical protein VOLCADRAFT_90236 [Volvox carteri f. nagariensis]
MARGGALLLALVLLLVPAYRSARLGNQPPLLADLRVQAKPAVGGLYDLALSLELTSQAFRVELDVNIGGIQIRHTASCPCSQTPVNVVVPAVPIAPGEYKAVVVAKADGHPPTILHTNHIVENNTQAINCTVADLRDGSIIFSALLTAPSDQPVEDFIGAINTTTPASLFSETFRDTYSITDVESLDSSLSTGGIIAVAVVVPVGTILLAAAIATAAMYRRRLSRAERYATTDAAEAAAPSGRSGRGPAAASAVAEAVAPSEEPPSPAAPAAPASTPTAERASLS